jgi:serine/threonine-protein kinase
MNDLLQRLTAALAGRYSVEGLAGEGGMATVFRATDLKHHRPVAIKVLKPELAATIGSERFLQEIELSARLQHPHIVPLYDSGDAGGILYYVMPFVEGESLRDRLAREKRVPFEEAVTLNREIASALGYAHAQGIVHRDIKPENIMLSGGHAVVADFGIARALRVAAGGSQMTGLGFAIGTPAYMSPEQATASEVDGRSDQYSLACVFYEMVSGQAPFSAPTVQAVLTQSLTGPRPKLSKITRTTPPEADAPVQRALAADPAGRFATVQEFASTLERSAGGGAGAVAERRRLRRLAIGLPLAVAVAALGWIFFGPKKAGAPVVAGAESIAVLPFSTSGAGVELMGEGMVDLLSTNLNSVGGIHAVDPRIVLSRWKKQGVSGGGADVETALGIARAVKAQAALVGSIVATGSRVRMSADLYGPEGKSLARAQVDGAADSVLALVDELSRSLVREIWRSKEPVPSLRVSGLTTGSLEAMRDYLTGEQFYRRAEWDSAGAAFQQAIDQDSTFALAHYRLAMSLGWKGGYALPRAREASQAALRFSSRLQPKERALVAAYQLFSQASLQAVDSMRKYVATYPDDVEGWYLLGETQYHTRERTGADPRTIESSFDKVLAGDSTLTPALIHPLELTLGSRDSSRYVRYLNLLRNNGSPDEYETFRAAGAVVWQNKEPDTLAARLLSGHFGAAMASFTAVHNDPVATGDDVLKRFAILQRVFEATGNDGAKLQMTVARGMVMSSLGRFKDEIKLADSLRPISMEQSGGLRLFPLLMGFAPPDYETEYVARFNKVPISSPFMAYVASTLSLAKGDAQRGGKLADSLLASDTTKYPPFLRSLILANRGWSKVVAGDTVNGLKEMARVMEQPLNGGTFLTGAVRMQYAIILASRADTRQQGIALLSHGFDTDIAALPLANLALAKAYEASGEKAKAAEAYGRFLHQWNKADEAARPRIDEAKDALQRLTGEGQK